MKKVRDAFTASGADEGAYKAFKAALRACMQALRQIDRKSERDKGVEALRGVRTLLASPALSPLCHDLGLVLPSAWASDWKRLCA